MCGRVAVLLLLLGSTLSSQGQCSWTPRESAAFRTTAFDVAVDGPLVWLATGYGVQLLSSGGTRVEDAIPLPGSTRVVRADGRGFAYVGSGSRLYVLRRDGSAISVVRFADAGATIQDILIAGPYIFVATANGLAHFESFGDSPNPIRTTTVLPTSSPNVTSLAISGTTLYAADGDTTVEVFSITIPSIPQHTGELTTVVRAAAVHADAGGAIFVSDAFGQTTDVFAGTTSLARLPIGASSFAAGMNGVHFVAGPDRTLRAVDFTSTSVLKELFEHQLAPTGGTDNVIHAIARAGNTLFVAAGDIGLATFDVRSLTPPYPLVSYRTAPANSTVLSGDRAWFADRSGTILEQRIVVSGLGLVTERTWMGGGAVNDVEGSTLLTSTGKSTTLWSLTPQTPAAISTSTFRSSVKAAALRGEGVVALLDDGSVWIGGTTPEQVTLPNIARLARAGNAYLFVETRDEGVTILHHYPTSDLASAPRRFTVQGVAIGGAALDATRAAVFTFNGVNIVDVSSGTTRVIAGSNRTIPQQLTFAGDNLLVLDRRTLSVYGSSLALLREHFLPADGEMLAAGASLAVLATAEGTLVLSYLAQQPARTTAFTSTFYTKLVTSEDRVYLFAPGAIDVYSMAGDTPRYLTSIRAPGTIGFAATRDALFTLSAAGVVTSYSRQGALLRQMTINEGTDAQPLSIDVAGNAVWVSLSKGCLTGGCQQKTLVLDPVSLIVTASMNGGVKDVVSSGTRAYALVDFPAEVRVLDIAAPLQPSQILSAAAPPTATSLAAYAGRVYVLGDRLYEYTASTLLLSRTLFAPLTADKTQRIRVAGDCLVITGRTAHPELYNAATLAPLPAFEVPSPVRALAIQQGRLLLLTTHSLEVWGSGTTERHKRRSVR